MKRKKDGTVDKRTIRYSNPAKGKSQADKERDALGSIVALLDGKEWKGADTLDQIASICRAAGFTIAEPNK